MLLWEPNVFWVGEPLDSAGRDWGDHQLLPRDGEAPARGVWNKLFFKGSTLALTECLSASAKAAASQSDSLPSSPQLTILLPPLGFAPSSGPAGTGLPPPEAVGAGGRASRTSLARAQAQHRLPAAECSPWALGCKDLP